MTQPIMLYRNLLAEANSGRGDGTIYAWGTSAVISGSTFDLTTINIMTDLGADADDLFNGYQLVFTSSGRSYLISDWVAATDIATVFETPNAEDTADWTIRRTLYTNDFNVANPIRYSANGRLYQKWIDKAANNAVQIYAAAPNGVDDGGFEKNSIADFWAAEADGDGTAVINSTSPILGTYDCLLNMGTTATYARLRQTGKIDLRKGYTYGLIFKAKRDTAETTSKLFVQLRYIPTNTTAIPITFTKINSADVLTSVGSGINNSWFPVLETTAAWEEAIFTVPEDIDSGDWELRIVNNDTTNYYDCYVDEIYLWEIGPTPASGVGQPDTLVVGNHNFGGGFAAGSYVAGIRCSYNLTGYVAGNELDVLVDLDANVTVDGKSPIYETWTAATSIYPVMIFWIMNISGKTFEAGEIWVGKGWTWSMYPDPPITAKQLDIESTSTRARGGPRVSSKIYEQTIFNGSLELVSGTEADIWKLFISESGHGKPFWLRVPAQTNLGVTAETIFVNCKTPPKISEDPPVNYRVNFNFEESF